MGVTRAYWKGRRGTQSRMVGQESDSFSWDQGLLLRAETPGKLWCNEIQCPWQCPQPPMHGHKHSTEAIHLVRAALRAPEGSFSENRVTQTRRDLALEIAITSSNTICASWKNITLFKEIKDCKKNKKSDVGFCDLPCYAVVRVCFMYFVQLC